MKNRRIPGVSVNLDRALLAQLDTALGSQVASAMDRGQCFTATIEHTFPMYDDAFKQTGAYVDIKVEYLLDKDQPAIEVPTAWRVIDTPQKFYEIKSFFTKVAGVTHEGRQRIVARCSEGERLLLIRESDNPIDEGAIKVVRLNGEQLGYIPAHVARRGDSSGLASEMDRGRRFQCRIKDLTGGGPGRSLGVNIEVKEGDEFEALERPSFGKEVPVYSVLFSNNGSNHSIWLWLFAAVAVLIIIGVIVAK